MKKNIMGFACMALVMSACTTTQNPNTTSDNAMVTGTYYAKLPCPDCSGIVVDAVFEADKTYSTAITFQDSDSFAFENGTWSVSGDKLMLTPTEPAKSDDGRQLPIIKALTIMGDKLFLLDKNGKPYSNSKPYRFTRKQ